MSMPTPNDLPPGDPDAWPLLSAQQFAQVPDDPFWRYELVRGRVVREPPVGPQHGSIAAKLAHVLLEFVEPRGLGSVRVESGYVLAHDADTVRGPDVSFMRHEQLGSLTTAGWPHVPPDLAVEVLSPSDRAGKVREKVQDYLTAGCPLVWVVDARRRVVTVHEPSGAARVVREHEELDGGAVLPGFRLPVIRLFT
jgi:Uma2 family endonuclease